MTAAQSPPAGDPGPLRTAVQLLLTWTARRLAAPPAPPGGGRSDRSAGTGVAGEGANRLPDGAIARQKGRTV